jgi:hypothetical protein
LNNALLSGRNHIGLAHSSAWACVHTGQVLARIRLATPSARSLTVPACPPTASRASATVPASRRVPGGNAERGGYRGVLPGVQRAEAARLGALHLAVFAGGGQELVTDRELEPVGGEPRQKLTDLALSLFTVVGGGDVQGRTRHVRQVQAAVLVLGQPVHLSVRTAAMHARGTAAPSSACGPA